MALCRGGLEGRHLVDGHGSARSYSGTLSQR